MAIVTTINKLVEDIFPTLIECLKEDSLEELIIEGADYLRQLIDTRVHDEGLASDEQPIASDVRAQTSFEGGDYSQGHGKKRSRRGLQTAFIDLLYEGNLRASLITGEFNNKITIGFANEAAGRLAGYHEEYRQKEIYAPTENELELLREFYSENLLPNYIKECLEFQRF